MASDGPTHLLSLKVMRVSAHSSASILSLQGSSPLPGHPKTLRDLTHASELLTLPASFGSIQLGETFSSCLCVNNEATSAVEVKQIKVEMQTVTTKVTLSELDETGPTKMLEAGDSLETIVHHEIKELGQHVLACTVTYRLPPSARPVPGAAEDASDPSLLTFRKFYKFAVTNPLSVKTKVHTSKSPSASLSLDERDKLFLEVHIQNLTPASMFFEKMRFECAEGFDVDDINGPVFSGSFATMQPQDTRQYVYILTPKSTTVAPPALPPGSIIPLGRLDISWRSSYGEPGRLLTSMLTRRIPFPQPQQQQPVSAVPSYLKRAVAGGSISRPQSPQQSRPMSPPVSAQRPGSPAFQSPNRPQSMGGQPIRPQSPSTATMPAGGHGFPHVTDVEVSLIVKYLPRKDIVVEKPFAVTFGLVVTRNPDVGKRKLVFAVQHLRPPKAIQQQPLTAQPQAHPQAAGSMDMMSPRAPSSGFATPQSGAATPFNYALAHQKILDVANAAKSPLVDSPIGEGHDTPGGAGAQHSNPILPIPYFEGYDELRPLSDGVIATGASAVFLPPITLSSGEEGTANNPAVQEFQLTFVPVRRGFVTIGGLRILLVEDTTETEGEEPRWKPTRIQTLKEYDVIGEVWVPS
ncbi:hypothetical protein CC1G_05171 [Coprinopsis cinerea okayama7|uniref:DUF974-domain-containing protein n=1 Tax=Coprinopsis cinerea (strain Okayama-7 / 130 / ATCC MYA-4618 / FGSC 9003) TaxID=240176 RepID=A8NG44_COPC7|nr:hypothetical protein CC1G_05171 [Coprinopsis cinerea okayama7\|eukprot:XP_001833471.2 hypothetical protein CC1G_05171 [Coprinopsis cinerea okayama7\